jgi:hypothetical protein
MKSLILLGVARDKSKRPKINMVLHRQIFQEAMKSTRVDALTRIYRADAETISSHLLKTPQSLCFARGLGSIFSGLLLLRGHNLRAGQYQV